MTLFRAVAYISPNPSPSHDCFVESRASSQRLCFRARIRQIASTHGAARDGHGPILPMNFGAHQCCRLHHEGVEGTCLGTLQMARQDWRPSLRAGRRRICRTTQRRSGTTIKASPGLSSPRCCRGHALCAARGCTTRAEDQSIRTILANAYIDRRKWCDRAQQMRLTEIE